MATWMGGEFAGEWIHVNVWLDLFTVYLKLSHHCLLIGYTPIHNVPISFIPSIHVRKKGRTGK